MNTFNRRSESVVDISTSSLPDIVFLLLFYFMVSATIKQPDNLLKAQVPHAHYLTSSEKKFLVKEILIGFPKMGSLGTEPRISSEGRLLTLNEISNWVEEQRNSLPAYYRDKMIIMIKSDQNVEMSIVYDLQEQLRKANARKIVYRSFDDE